MSVQIPQGRAEAINRLDTHLPTTRQRNKDKEEET